MATSKQKMTPARYFKPGVSVNEENINRFRELYRQLSKIDCFGEHTVDKRSLVIAAEKLGIEIDMENDQTILAECVKYENEEDAFLCVDISIQGPVELQSVSTAPVTTTVLECPKTDEPPTIVKEVKCILIIKHQGNDINDFLRTFLLQVIKKTNTRNGNDNWSPSNNKLFLLDHGSLLALFIHEQMNLMGTIRRRQYGRFRLVEPLNINDEFGAWSYDHFRGLFELELRPHLEESFPSCWVLASDAQIHCQFIFIGTRLANETMRFTAFERPRTSSLELFVEDVCTTEGNGKATKWLEELRAEDILTFSHLSNLKQTEWDHIKRLSMNAKRILKAAVDRERESVSDDRRRMFEAGSPGEELPKLEVNRPKENRSELLANLHLIKLFVYHTLRFEHALQRSGALSKLEAACIKASFNEMIDEGYADDDLFPTMAEFFLPLTISEQELRMTRSIASSEARRNQLSDLTKQVERLEYLSREATMYRWDVDERITKLNQVFEETSLNSKNRRFQVNTKLTPLEQAKELQNIDRQQESNKAQYEKKLVVLRNELDQWVNRIVDYEKQIDDFNTQINNIRAELNQPQRPVDKGLVKPARGFIMYGPPGTGKSEIMSKLSTKLGICMVGPPLAAGELNRPLVGESERVIIALASRCHRVPYAMCCLSIDEIDSLAPKRDEDSSEGKVDKIGVLLSLIDGIKDVPNLMIFCATNRLHMMDEAFLRRMSGKFFVGRPSSQARTKILSQIPEWALEPNLIDGLTIASTNFSGAACKAYTRAITVRSIAVQRDKPTYLINYKEALKIADRTAQQYQIFLGSDTLPRLLLRNLMSGSKIRVNHLSRHLYTGRIIVDIHGGSARIEVIENNRRISVIEHELSPNETSVQSLLERLTVYGKDRNVQLLQLVDLNLLASQGAYDEKKVFETLKERYDECVAYKRSMIIYDLDALVGVNKSESDSSMGRSMSSSVVNQNVYTYVRARFREAVVEQQQDDDDNKQQQSVEKWSVAIIREPFLMRQFSSDVQFARTRLEEEEFELERQKAEDLLKCVKCKDLYLEIENKMGNCVHHDGFIYDNSAPDLTVHTFSEVTFDLNKLEGDAINYPEQREEFERQKTKFKWICCDSIVTTGLSAGGCKKGKHSFGEQLGDRRRRRRRQDGHRLDQAIIKQWEDECRHNQEYNERWLLLLENRS